jgi:hypothetical protein
MMKLDTSKLLGFRLLDTSRGQVVGAKVGEAKPPGQVMGAKIGAGKPSPVMGAKIGVGKTT